MSRRNKQNAKRATSDRRMTERKRSKKGTVGRGQDKDSAKTKKDELRQKATSKTEVGQSKTKRQGRDKEIQNRGKVK